ncbi:MAG: AraC family transcriptional regulator [Hydrocarboniphaga sp.]|uniref:AraC family transcriptional regulator n=1 Tax=Hydrocarboniphaga sp. TaxID=2033016 RepID=UPI002615C00C|nr:AraC family transcriptional regulator [Hydrocarboniphaga sp.]MDB5971145.1 AraC family transcriptional regulator [Hydrocarboniphaga sp.]
MNQNDSTDRSATTQRTISIIGGLAPNEGYNLTALPDVRFLRSNRALDRAPVLYDPGIVIVCQGRKRGFLGSDVYLYDANHYLVVSVPIPFSMETDASEREPLLAIYFRLDLNVAADLLLQLQESGSPVVAKPKGMVSTLMDPRLLESVLRFLEVMSSPIEAAILGPALVREIYFRVFVGEQGGTMRAALAKQGHFGKIARALRKIHIAYTDDLDVERLAKEAKMSVPTFHAHFKSVTNTSPIQYLKSTRLHQARLLMVRSDITATLASSKVGYESASQFNREFKRMFGKTPIEEVDRMKRTFAYPAPAPSSIYIASH